MYRAFTGKFRGKFKLFDTNFVFSYNKKKFCTGSDRCKVVRSPCVSVPLPAEDSNLFRIVFQQFPKYGKKIALIDGVTGRQCSYAELHESVVNMASGLVRSGLKRGDVLTLVSPNSAEFCVTFFATLASGGTVSTCNPLYTAEELAYQFGDSNSKYVATTPALLTTVKEAINKSGCVEKIIVISNGGGIGERNHDLISYQNLVKSNGLQFPCNVALNSKLDNALISYSSGTTGPPKGVMLTHYNLSWNVMQLTHSKEMFGDFYCSGNLLAVMPFFHGFGMLTMLSGLYMGSSKIIMPKFVPKLFLSLVERYKITGVSVVPPIILFLANHQMVDEYDVSSLQHITYSAAPTASEIAVKLKHRLGLRHLQQCFGMTEACTTHVTPVDVFKPASVGVPLSHVSCKVVDVDTGAAMGPNCQGELVVRGPQVMKGYLNNSIATAATIRNGWLHTGDLAHYDQDGYFYVTDRLKELIKVKGFQVAPAELEALLLQNPYITDVAVVGVDDERSGELPRAFVVRSSDDLTELQVENYVKGQVAEYKQLKGGVKFIKEIPKSASGKILRNLLKQKQI